MKRLRAISTAGFLSLAISLAFGQTMAQSTIPAKGAGGTTGTTISIDKKTFQTENLTGTVATTAPATTATQQTAATPTTGELTAAACKQAFIDEAAANDRAAREFKVKMRQISANLKKLKDGDISGAATQVRETMFQHEVLVTRIPSTRTTSCQGEMAFMHGKDLNQVIKAAYKYNASRTRLLDHTTPSYQKTLNQGWMIAFHEPAPNDKAPTKPDPKSGGVAELNPYSGSLGSHADATTLAVIHFRTLRT